MTMIFMCGNNTIASALLIQWKLNVRLAKIKFGNHGSPDNSDNKSFGLGMGCCFDSMCLFIETFNSASTLSLTALGTGLALKHLVMGTLVNEELH